MVTASSYNVTAPAVAGVRRTGVRRTGVRRTGVGQTNDVAGAAVGGWLSWSKDSVTSAPNPLPAQLPANKLSTMTKLRDRQLNRSRATVPPLYAKYRSFYHRGKELARAEPGVLLYEFAE